MPEELPIQKLLRLKRYEQPPEGYPERFLMEFQRRQRAGLMRKSGWHHFLAHMAQQLAQFRVGPLAYAATITLAGVLSYHFLVQSPGGTAPAAPHFASTTSAAPTASYIPQTTIPSRVTIPANSLSMPVSGKFSPTQYVLEPHPVSHEHPFAF